MEHWCESGHGGARRVRQVLAIFVVVVVASAPAAATVNVAGSGGGGTLALSGDGLATMNGNGTAANPYRITNATQLQAMSGNRSAHYVLANDVDAAGTATWNNGSGFDPIGNASKPFEGTLDGKGHAIRGLSIDRTGSYVGLFGYVGSGARIVNVGLSNATITQRGSGQSVGALIGANYGTVNGSSAAVSLTSNGSFTGGLVGVNQGTVTTSSATGAISSTAHETGGLVGDNGGNVTDSNATVVVTSNETNTGGLIGGNDGNVSFAYATGNVTSTASYTGGLIGVNTGNVSETVASGDVTSSGLQTGGLVGHNSGDVSGSHATGAVDGSAPQTGGLVGYNPGDVSRAYATGAVSGNGDVGGLIGRSYGAVAESFATGNVTSTNANSGGLIGYNAGNVSAAYATGNATGRVSHTGGLIGANEGGNVSESYSVGVVAGTTSFTGGLVGADNGTVAGSYWDVWTAGQSTSAGGTMLKTPQMTGTAAITNMTAFDFNGTWRTTTTYPQLGWSNAGTPRVPGSGTTSGGSGSSRSSSPAYMAGSGTAADPYRITNVTQLQAVNRDRTANYTLANDVDATGTATWNNGSGFRPLGNGSMPFQGTLDGEGHAVRGLAINRSKSFIGMFGVVGRSGVVTNVTVAEADVVQRDSYAANVGPLAGKNNGTVIRSSASGIVTNQGSKTGGLIGGSNGNVSDSYATTTVTDTRGSAGGLIGYNYNYSVQWGFVTDSYATGNVTSSGSDTGGLIGDNYRATVTGSYAVGDVSSSGSNTGGLIGFNGGSGSLSGGRVSGSYWDVEATNQSSSDGGTGLPTANMTGTAARTNMTALDFNDTWRTTASYPRLRWQNATPTSGGSGSGSNAGLAFMSGDGTGADPYRITNVTQLQAVNQNRSANYVLASDIDATGTATWNNGSGFEPLGNGTEPFVGRFEGRGHAVRGLAINRTDFFVGLFGVVGRSGVVRNVSVVKADVVQRGSGYYVGPLAGKNNGTVTRSSASGIVTSDAVATGGLIGGNTGNVSDTYASTSVTSTARSTGGLIGYNLKDTFNHYWGVVTASYAVGNVTGNASSTGGLVGSNKGGIVSKSYWDTNATTQPSSAGGTGLPTANMTGAAARTNMTGFDFNTIWTTTASYPQFRWQMATPSGGSGSGGSSVLATMAGNGTALDPYRITNVTQLQAMNLDRSAHYVLANDIDASSTRAWNGGSGFDPVGDTSAPSAEFNGTLDGNGHAIRGLWMNRNGSNVGLFGYVGSLGRVRNLSLVNVTVIQHDGYQNVGGLAGGNEGDVSNVTVTGSVFGNASFTGGLIGYNYGGASVSVVSVRGSVRNNDSDTGGLMGENAGNVSRASANVSVSGNGAITGGLIGYNGGNASLVYATGAVFASSGSTGGLIGDNVGSVSRAYANALVESTYAQNGGLVGSNDGTISEAGAGGNVTSNASENGGLVGYNSGTVLDSYATGNLTNTTPNTGGLVGHNYGGTVSRAYAVGSVAGNATSVGGLIGLNETTWGYVSGAYWDVGATNQSSSDGGVPLTTAQMTGAAADTNMTALDFGTTWTTTATYPELRWIVRVQSGGNSTNGTTGGGTSPSIAHATRSAATTSSGSHHSSVIDVDAQNVTLGGNGTYAFRITNETGASVTVIPNVTGTTRVDGQNVIFWIYDGSGAISGNPTLGIGSNHVPVNVTGDTGMFRDGPVFENYTVSYLVNGSVVAKTAPRIYGVGYDGSLTQNDTSGLINVTFPVDGTVPTSWYVELNVINYVGNNSTADVQLAAPMTRVGDRFVATINASKIQPLSPGDNRDTNVEFHADGTNTSIPNLWVSSDLTYDLTSSNGTGSTNGSQPTTLVVAADGSANYTSIGAAVDNATAGDTIEVRPGTYRESVVLDKNLTVVAPDGATLAAPSNATNGTIGFRIGANVTGAPTIDGFAVEDFDYGIGAPGTASDWTVRNTTIANANISIVAKEARGNWSLRNVTARNDSRYGVYAGNTTGDWTVENTTVRDSAVAGIVAPNTTGDWSIRGTAVVNSSSVGVVTEQSSGAWTISDSAVVGTSLDTGNGVPVHDGIGVFAADTSGAWEIRNTTLVGHPYEAVNATGAVVTGDASYDYWGASDGPSGDFAGSGGAAVGNLVVNPYYADRAMSAVSTVNRTRGFLRFDPVGTTVRAGGNASMTVQITNDGVGPANASVQVGSNLGWQAVDFQNASGTWYPGRQFWTTEQTNPIGSNGFRDPSITLHVPNGTAHGRYYLNATGYDSSLNTTPTGMRIPISVVEPGDVQVLPENRTAAPGSNVTVPVRLTNVTGGVYYSSTLAFDPAVLQAQYATMGGKQVYTKVDNANGTVEFSVQGTNMNDPVVNVTFAVVGKTNTSSPVDITAASAYTSSLNPKPVLGSGRVTVTNGTTSPGVTVRAVTPNRPVGASGTAKIDIVASNVTDGVGTFESTLSLPGGAGVNVTNVTFAGSPNMTDVRYGANNTSVTLSAVGMSTPAGDGVLLATVTVELPSRSALPSGGENVSVGLSVAAVGTPNGTSYRVDRVDNGTLRIRELAPVGNFSHSPKDLNGDGTFEDVNGDGTFDIVDVQALFHNRGDSTITSNDWAFDYNGDGTFDVVDVQRLFAVATQGGSA